ncbi:TetR/AcrR family transcriptional regulator [Nocardia stercoris]|uniref:TetR/AcrR family transcriptional regulator n=1 Tax=Nocardia stercoris TaxID=2483361 RepID=A0A3M2LD06_9NOCA|nr:TetR/AcrR family transcriptional regulator [Nocardia stercoris]RMI35401.1 TetR/AcrR family transcriptional regulator [Nocardia stercoris]
MNQTAPAPGGTRERLLAAAEQLLLVSPYDEVSVRAICAAAGANAAAAHYHFGSKEALVSALLEDRLGPVWADRLAAVTEGESSVADVVDAVIEPFVTLVADPIGQLHVRLLAQFVAGRHSGTGWQGPWFTIGTWAGLLPGVDPAEAGRRWMLAFDLIILRFGVGQELSPRSVASLRDFVLAGLTAPQGDTR